MSKKDLYSQSDRRDLWPLLAILGNWTVMIGAILTASHFEFLPLTLCAIVLIGARQHALFILIHEAVHGHLSRNRYLNETLSNLFCAFPLLFDTEVYRKNHLKHHRHLNSDQDPDWVRKVGLKEWTFPVTAKQMALFVPYFVFLRGPYEWACIIYRFSGFTDKQRWKTEPFFLLFKASYFVLTAAAFIYFGVVTQALLFWFIPMFFGLTVAGRIRSVAEHFALNYKDELNSTRDVKTSWIEGFLISPHNVNLHLTHHLHPHIPFYALPKAHQTLTKAGQLVGAHVNGSYVFPFEKSVLQDVLTVRPAAPALRETA
jgi:fatty acid desaturase